MFIIKLQKGRGATYHHVHNHISIKIAMPGVSIEFNSDIFGESKQAIDPPHPHPTPPKKEKVKKLKAVAGSKRKPIE